MQAKCFAGLTGERTAPYKGAAQNEADEEPLHNSGLLNGGGRSRKAGVVIVELFTELLDLLFGGHVGGGGLTIVVGVPWETEKVEGRRDAGLR